jgi:GT2 family glycosyltransferase
MDFEVIDCFPLNADDYFEAKLSQNNTIRSSSFERQSPQIKNRKIRSWLRKIIRISINKVSDLFPRGSRSRLKARQISEKLPGAAQNLIRASLAPLSHFQKNIFFHSHDLGFGIPTCDKPQVTIVIPVYNNWWVTYKCLRALQRSTNVCEYEVIVVNDASTDLTRDGLRSIRGIKVVHNHVNLGYLESTNRGASLAAESSKFVVLLNNDTEPIADWLDELLLVFKVHPEAAIVGSTLFYSDGRIQESGAQIFNSANGWNIGRDFSELNDMFRSVREVDYCSAAAVMVRKNFWLEVNGFDPLYKPAYYEDSDLAMSAWSRGLKVYISPRSWVIHQEGASHGTSLKSGVKKNQSINLEKFQNKWKKELNSHWDDEGSPRVEYARDSKGIIVICDHEIPDSTRDSGSQRTIRIIEALMSLKYHVVLSGIEFSVRNVQVEKLRQMGVEVHTDRQSLMGSLRYRSHRISYFWTIREEVYTHFSDELRMINNSAPFIGDLLDLRHEDNSKIHIAKRQLKITNEVDHAILVSPIESKKLREISGKSVSDLWYDFPSRNYEFAATERSGLIFVGGFRHAPNLEGIFWFAKNVMPYLLSLGFKETVVVIGSGLNANQVNDLAESGLTVLGYQKDIELHYASAKIAILPLQSGAGLKGKFAEALSFGLPVITTSVGAEGFPESTPGDSPYIVADTAMEFAQKIMLAISDFNFCQKLSNNTRLYLDTFFSEEIFLKKVSDVLESSAKNTSKEKDVSR